jgi:hypothetical protein
LNPPTHSPSAHRSLAALCRGEASLLERWFAGERAGGLATCALTVLIGASLYGFTVGFWRAPEMGLYVAIKLPLLIFLVLIVNGLINGMFASLLGSGLTFRQTLTMSLASFTTAALMLGALSPITFFMVLNAPPADTPESEQWHRNFLLTHTALIAYAGITGNVKAYRMLAAFIRDVAAARRTLVAWLAVNLFVGAQLSYNLRPFFGNPTKEVRFLRANPFDGSFYEVVARSLGGLFGAP